MPPLDIHDAYKGTWEDQEIEKFTHLSQISETHIAKNPFVGNVVLGSDLILIIKNKWKSILNQKDQHIYFPDHMLESFSVKFNSNFSGNNKANIKTFNYKSFDTCRWLLGLSWIPVTRFLCPCSICTHSSVAVL